MLPGMLVWAKDERVGKLQLIPKFIRGSPEGAASGACRRGRGLGVSPKLFSIPLSLGKGEGETGGEGSRDSL